jgi:hypothetical protein
MEWTEIDYMGTKIWATDFLDGVLVRTIRPSDTVEVVMTGCVGWRGWYVQEARGDMDGPALRKREEKEKEFAIRLVKAK